MPIYEYKCDKCDNSFEELVSSTLIEVVCPICKSPEVQRQLSVFSASVKSGASEAPPCGQPSCPSGFT